MSPQGGVTHHVSIADQAGTNKFGFMMAKRRRGRIQYAVEDAQQIQNRTLTMGELTEAEAPPQLRMYWTMDDWTAGVGGVLDREHKQRTTSTTLIDQTERNKIRPARNFTASTQDSAGDDAHPTGFAAIGSAEMWAFIGRDVFLWDSANSQWDIKNEPQSAGVVYRTAVEFSGNAFAPCWDETEDFPDDYIYKSDNDTQWTVSTSGERAKYFALGRDANGQTAVWAGFIHRDSTSNINEGGEYSDSDVTLTVTDGTDFAVNDIIAIEDELLLVTAISTNDLTVVRAFNGTTAAAHSDSTDIYIHLPHHIQSSVALTNAAAWNTSIAVGTVDAPITGLITDGGTLLVCKTDGIWAFYEDGTAENLTPQFENRKHPDNFRNGFNWNGHIILPLGEQGMFELFEGRLYDISMKNYAPTVTEWHGRVAGVGGNPTKLFIMVVDASNTKYHCFMAEWITFNGKVDWHWHHIGEISYTTNHVVNHAVVWAEGQVFESGATVHHRCWFGVESTGSSLLPHFYPLEGDTIATFSAASTMTVKFPDYDGNFARISKNCVQVDIDSNNLGASGRKWTLKYQLDGGAVKTDLTDSAGNADGVVDATGGQETLTFPDNTTCDVLTLIAVPASDAATSTAPEITKIRVTFQLRPDRLRLLPMTFYLADHQTLLNGTTGGTTNTALAQLRTWDDQAAPVTVIDIEGTSRDYIFLPGNMKIEQAANEYGRRKEFLVSVVLAQV